MIKEITKKQKISVKTWDMRETKRQKSFPDGRPLGRTARWPVWNQKKSEVQQTVQSEN